MSDIHHRWAEDQRQLRTHLVTDDQLNFHWPPQVTDITTTMEEECKSDSENAGAIPHVAKPALRYIGGVDISFVGGEDTPEACAALVVVEYPTMKLVYEDYQMVRLTQPYISGFLAFREVEHLLNLLDRLRSDSPDLFPQIVMVDGNGVLHHRRFGLASHFGVLADLPTIGIGKNLLLVDGLDRSVVQQRSNETLHHGGESFDLIGESGQVWGACLRATDTASNPIYVSIGHRISLQTATQLVHACCHHRIPEPVRLADLNSREFIRKWKAAGAVMPPEANRRMSVGIGVSAGSSASSSVSDFLPSAASSVPATSSFGDDGDGGDYATGGARSPFTSLSPPHEQKFDAECIDAPPSQHFSPPIESALTHTRIDPHHTHTHHHHATIAMPAPIRQQSDPTDVRSARNDDGYTSPSASTHRDRSRSTARSKGTYIPAERTPACIIS